MKHKATLLLMVIFTLFLVSCIEIEVSDVQRIELIDFNPPGVINVDDPISLDNAKLNVYIQGETEPETLVLSSEDVVLSGTGYDSLSNTLKTSSVGTYTLKVSYGGVSVILTYRVYGTDVLGVGPHDTYTDLQTAIDAADVGDTIQLTSDYDTSVGFVVGTDDVITLDLAGHVLAGISLVEETWALITNHGTLVIEDNSKNQNGKITTAALHPDMRPIPGYASNTIKNLGTLTINSGTVENTTNGIASYAIDAQSGSVTINGGMITGTYTFAIRQFLNSSSVDSWNEINVTDGLIHNGIWVQNGSENDNGSLNISGGIFSAKSKSLLIGYDGAFENYSVLISGGIFEQSVVFKYPDIADYTITGDAQFDSGLKATYATVRLISPNSHSIIFEAFYDIDYQGVLSDNYSFDGFAEGWEEENSIAVNKDTNMAVVFDEDGLREALSKNYTHIILYDQIDLTSDLNISYNVTLDLSNKDLDVGNSSIIVDNGFTLNVVDNYATLFSNYGYDYNEYHGEIRTSNIANPIIEGATSNLSELVDATTYYYYYPLKIE